MWRDMNVLPNADQPTEQDPLCAIHDLPCPCLAGCVLVEACVLEA